MAGAPVGNQNAARAKQWRLAIDRALDKRGSSRAEALDLLAEKLLLNCEQGDMTALKELGDRLDGKPAQTIAGDPDNPLQLSGTLNVLGVAPNR
jgi:hypothetical protein